MLSDAHESGITDNVVRRKDTDCLHASSLPTVELFGIPMLNLTQEEFLDHVEQRIARRASGYVVTPNVDHLCRHAKDAAFRAAYADAFAALPDGVPLMWFSKVVGRSLKAKLSGSDMVPLLCERAALKGFRVYFLGAAPGVAEEAAEKLRTRYPGLVVAGTCSPPLGFERNSELSAQIAAKVRQASPDICFVALGAPKQEFWMQRWCNELGIPLALGIGGTLDFEAGRTRRAPVVFQRAGLEWFWRLCQEPRRLWRRYLVEDAYFLVMMWREYWTTRKSAAG